MKEYLYEDLYRLEDKHWWHISKRRAIRQLVEKYNNKENPKILDIGCGTGKNLEEFKQYGRTYGLDNSQEAIKFCQKRGLKNIKLGKAEKTPFKINSFDLITLLDVLEHTDDDRALEEIYRILKKNGLLLITVPAFRWLWSKWDEVLHHKRRYTIDNLSSVLQRHKFTITYATYLYSFLVLPALIIRQIKQKLFRSKEYSSDFKLSTSLLNKIVCIVAETEFKIAQKLPIPIGTSILVVAKK